MRYDEASFMATHNSYSGGSVGDLPSQLEWGARGVELDIHAIGGARFEVGHAWPGHEVWSGGGNPRGLSLADWLQCIVDWTGLHPHHAPITLVLDYKSDASQARSWFEAIDTLLRVRFERRLLPPAEIASGWPEVESIRGRVLVVLSGDLGARRAYLARGVSASAAFIDRQPGDDIDAVFCAAPASDRDWLRSRRAEGRLTRAWQFNSTDDATSWPSFPATDRLYEPWYTEFCQGIGVLT